MSFTLITELPFWFSLLCLLLGAFYAWLFSEPDDESASAYGDKLALVELNEPIISSEDIVRQFKKFRDNKSIKAIVFRVESPGGGVAASQEKVRTLTFDAREIIIDMPLNFTSANIRFLAETLRFTKRGSIKQ